MCFIAAAVVVVVVVVVIEVLALSMGPNRAGVSLLSPEDGNRSRIPDDKQSSETQQF
jgi:hypothetical protein